MKLHPKIESLSLALVSLALTSQQALAALPVVVAPSTGPAAGGYLEVIKGYAKDGGLVLGLVLAIGALLWIAYHFLQDLHQVRQGRKEMGELVTLGIVGGGVLLIVMFLANEATTVIT